MRLLILWLFCLVLPEAGQIIHAAPPTAREPFTAFYAFDTAFWSHSGWTEKKQAQLLRKLGYDGIGMSGLKNLEKRIAAFNECGLKVFNLYEGARLDADPVVSPALNQAFPIMQRHQIDLWMPLSGSKDMSEEQKVDALRQLADAAGKYDVRVIVYPHFGNLAPTATSALPLVRKADRDNLGLTINLCHELRSGNGQKLPSIIKECGPYIKLVSINGADRDGKDWGKLIQPLDRGDYPLATLLEQLTEAGYAGSIGLQCYGIKEDPATHLQRSMPTCKELVP
jgi:sugar phosphate isomerase/epimerase